MNLPWNHKSDSSDAAGSSQSSKHRGLKSAWSGLKTALRPCGRQDKSDTWVPGDTTRPVLAPVPVMEGRGRPLKPT
ncbi:hypothetical protein BASA83_012020 [Batrachochytrium salamandrivorans]|nr:hypothetical protein BASA83_012020 [Batrachochytrium salamandrivorans]